MEQINPTAVDTAWGYRAFELYHGHVLDFDSPVHLLVVSVLVGDWHPPRGTVIGAVYDTSGTQLFGRACPRTD
jgi:hypothetical protein